MNAPSATTWKTLRKRARAVITDGRQLSVQTRRLRQKMSALFEAFGQERQKSEDKIIATLRRQLRHRTAEVLAFQEQSHVVARQAREAEADRRHRLARALHDTLAQLLALGEMRLSAVADRHGRDPDLDKAREHLREAAHFTRSLMTMLSLPETPRSSLGKAMEDARREMAGYGLEVTLSGKRIKPLMKDAVIATLFACVRELLFNVLKHGGVAQAELAASVEGGRVIIEVRDKGRGIRMRARPNSVGHEHFGLIGVREKLATIGGSMEVCSSRGQGTRVRVEAPLAWQGCKDRVAKGKGAGYAGQIHSGGHRRRPLAHAGGITLDTWPK